MWVGGEGDCKSGMVIPLKRGNDREGEGREGKWGERERFPKLIKCSGG